MIIIDIEIVDPHFFTFEEEDGQIRISLGNYKARVLPHVNARNLSPSDVLSFIIENLDEIGISILSSYLYDLLKNKKIRKIDVGNKKSLQDRENIYEEIIKSIIEDESKRDNF